MSLRLLVATVAAFAASWLSPADAQSPQPPQVTTTPAAAAFQAAASKPPYAAYPPSWIWDASTTTPRPQSATEDMGLQPKVEQYRNGQLVATYTRLGGAITSACRAPNRSDNPSTTVACGPFANGNPAWQAGDKFLVYPSVYKETVYLGPVVEKTASVSVTQGSNHLTIADTRGISAGDWVTGPSGQVPAIMHVLSVDSATDLTLDQPFLANGAIALSFLRSPKGLTIEGVTQNVNGVPTRPAIVYDDSFDGTQSLGKAMVYFYGQNGAGDIVDFTMRNIDLVVKHPPPGQSQWVTTNPYGMIYVGNQLSGTTTLEDMRIVGAAWMNGPSGANGILTGNPSVLHPQGNTGNIVLHRIEMGWNGGLDGPSHNAYFGEGNYALEVRGSWLHDVAAGHLLKTRAPKNIIVGNYFMGGRPLENKPQAESFDLNLPCGGEATVLDNIFTKGASNDNAFSITYNDGRCPTYVDHPEWLGAKTLDIRHNTFIAFSAGYDGNPVAHRNVPIGILSRSPTGAGTWILPGDPSYPAGPTTIAYNVFVGYVPSANSPGANFPWYGTQPAGIGPNLVADFSELTQSFAPFGQAVLPGDPAILGADSYRHVAATAPRLQANFGAVDASPAVAPAPAPTVFIMPRGSMVPAGTPLRLWWQTTGATGCTASGDWSGPQPIAGSTTVTPGQSSTYALSCTGPSGTASDSVNVNVVSPPTIASFTATPNAVAPGQPSTLSVQSQNADVCYLSDGGTGTYGANEVFNVSPPQTVAYSIECFGTSGRSGRQSLVVTVGSTPQKPTVYIEPNPKRISKSKGTIATLAWESKASDSCTGTGFDTGGAASGSAQVQPSVMTTYSVACQGPGGTSAVRSTQVVVDP